jgi:hypothetical protein
MFSICSNKWSDPIGVKKSFGVEIDTIWRYLAHMPRAAKSAPFTAAPSSVLRDFSNEEDRARLTPAALAAIRNLTKTWKLTGEEAASLLGISPTTWDRIRGDTWKQTLSQDQLTRVSALVGIFKALHLLFSDEMADRWPQLKNSGPIFQNLTPIAAMQRGGIPVMLDVRRYVDALRGGL